MSIYIYFKYLKHVKEHLTNGSELLTHVSKLIVVEDENLQYYYFTDWFIQGLI